MSYHYPQIEVLLCPHCHTTQSQPKQQQQGPQLPALCSTCNNPIQIAPYESSSSSASSISLSDADVDRLLETRLQSLTRPPVEVYLPTPSQQQLEKRLHRLLSTDPTNTTKITADNDDQLIQRLQRLEAGTDTNNHTSPPNEEELQQRLQRLTGELQSHNNTNANNSSHQSDPLEADSTETDNTEMDPVELEGLMREVMDDVRLANKRVSAVDTILSRPLRFSTTTTTTTTAAKTAKSDPSTTAASAPSAYERIPSIADDPIKLMEELQSLPSTQLAHLRHVSGLSLDTEETDTESEKENQSAAVDRNEEEEEVEERHEINNIVKAAIDEAKLEKQLSNTRK